MQKIFRAVLFLAVLVPTSFAFAHQDAPAKPEYDIKAHYKKYEYRIPMRDGVKLFTAVYIPKDKSQKFPFLIMRTPYSIGPYGADKYPRARAYSEFWKAGYIMVNQDVRGRFMSEGKFVEENPHIDNKKSGQVDESTDLYDTIDWLLKNIPNNNGRAGLWGISYPGFYTVSSMIDTHPALKACSPEAPMINLFMGDDAYHGGAFMLSANFGFYPFFRPQNNPMQPTGKEFEAPNYGTKDGYDFYLKMGPLSNSEKYFNPPNPMWDDQLKHDTYDDYWKVRDLAPHLKDIHCSVLTVGGWFDAEDLYGPFAAYRAIKKQNPGLSNTLVVGPWVHGGWAGYDGHYIGNADFGSNTGEFYRSNIVVPFFEHILKDAPDPKLPEAYVFETGSNTWQKYASWPPAEAKPATLYLQAGGKLSFEAPKAGAEFDEYVSDPAHPVPYVGYTPPIDVPAEYMASDQRFASRRPDVLVYQTDPLEDDVTILGPVDPKLFVSTSGTDSDYIVKLIDVYPSSDKQEDRASRHRGRDVTVPETEMSGFQLLVRGEPLRAKFRHSMEKPEAMTPNKVEEVSYRMQDVNHTFLKGHRIMVQIQSTWFPLIDRNPQTFVDIPSAKESDFVKATERVYHSPQQASGIEVLVKK